MSDKVIKILIEEDRLDRVVRKEVDHVYRQFRLKNISHFEARCRIETIAALLRQIGIESGSEEELRSIYRYLDRVDYEIGYLEDQLSRVFDEKVNELNPLTI